MNNEVFQKFDNGELLLPNSKIEFRNLSWNKHAVFDGVELKHIITSKETNGQFSFHLVRVAPNMMIGSHVHENQLETHEVISGFGVCLNEGKSISYIPGTISIIQKGLEHEVKAGNDGLYLFAKFIPALV